MKFLDDICEVRTRKFNKHDIKFAKAYLKDIIKQSSTNGLIKVEIKEYYDNCI